MPGQDSRDFGFFLIVLLVTLVFIILYVVYDKDEETVAPEASSNFVPRKYVPHDRLDLEAISRSMEREKPKPKPEPTPTPTSSPSPSPTKTVETNSKPKVTSNNSSLPALLLTIRQNESGGNYRAYNPDGCIGGCYGAYQLTAEYMDDWAREAGYPNYAYAGFWPPEIQDAVALYKFNQTGGALWCDWTDYC